MSTAKPAAAPPTMLEPPHRRLAAMLMLAGLVVVVGVLLAVVEIFLHTRVGQRVDEAVLDAAAFGRQRTLRIVRGSILAVSIVQVVGAAVLVAVIGLLRRRLALAAAGVALVVGSLGVVEVLKLRLLTRSEFNLTDAPGNSLPSGHAVVAVSVAMAVVLVVPPRVRPTAAVLGALYAFVTGSATLSAGWHRPSDVVASCLVALAVGLVLAAWLALVGTSRTGPSAAGADLRVSRWLGVLALLSGIAAALMAPGLGDTIAAGRAGELVAILSGVAAIGSATFGALAVWLPVAAFATRGRTPEPA